MNKWKPFEHWHVASEGAKLIHYEVVPTPRGGATGASLCGCEPEITKLSLRVVELSLIHI